MKQYIIGIDLGTGSAKAIAMDHKGDVVDSAQVSYPTLQPQQGYQEQNPHVIWDAFVAATSQLTSRLGPPEAICLSSAMHSIMPVDVNADPLTNLIIWADNRSASFARDIQYSPAGKNIYEKTGTPIHAMTPLCKLPWLKQHESAAFHNAYKFISAKEYVWFRMFSVFEVDYSIASATGLMDLETRSWNPKSLELVSLSQNRLSDLVNTNYTRKCTNAELCHKLGITTGTLFVIGASDGCLANIGSFATRPGCLAVTIGTSGAVRVIQQKPMLNFKAMTFNYLLDESTYVCGGPINNGGVTLRWYAENLLGKKLDSAAEYATLLEALDHTSPGANGLIFLPYILGERAPIWNSEASGVFFGMRAYHRQEHFTRAVVEGVSASLYDIAYNMIETGLDIDQIHVSGGFVHSEQWLQILADLFGKKICLVNTADASAVGACYLAMKAIGIISDYKELEPSQLKEYHPDPDNMEAYRKMFLKYREVYDHVAGLMTDKTLNP